MVPRVKKSLSLTSIIPLEQIEQLHKSLKALESEKANYKSRTKSQSLWRRKSLLHKTFLCPYPFASGIILGRMRSSLSDGKHAWRATKHEVTFPCTGTWILAMSEVSFGSCTEEAKGYSKMCADGKPDLANLIFRLSSASLGFPTFMVPRPRVMGLLSLLRLKSFTETRPLWPFLPEKARLSAFFGGDQVRAIKFSCNTAAAGSVSFTKNVAKPTPRQFLQLF